MEFTREFLEEELSKNDIVESSCIGHRRWYSNHRTIFRHEGKFYEFLHDRPLTEIQERDDEADPVECREVWPIEKTVTVYEVVA